MRSLHRSSKPKIASRKKQGKRVVRFNGKRSHFGVIMHYIFLILVLVPGVAVSEPYVFPEKVEYDGSCSPRQESLDVIREDYVAAPHCSTEKSDSIKVKEIDLNGDGECEFFVSRAWGRRCVGKTDIVDMNDGDPESLYSYMGGVSQAFASRRNGYIRLIHYTLGGHRVDPVYTAQVYYFNEGEYWCELCVDNSHGGYMDVAKEAYKNENYELAEIHYWNAYALNGESKLSDANNLALAYIKQEKYQKAIDLLQEHLAQDDETIAEQEAKNCYGGRCKPDNEELRELKEAARFNLRLAREGRAGKAGQ